MEIKKGMYIRTKKDDIKKVLDIGEYLGIKQYLLNEETMEYTIDSSIIKASFDIIDLLEVGDYVNGYRVDSIGEKIIYCCEDCYEDYCIKINKEDIKSIVTKEQFESIKYRLGE